jgi:phage repressor protein C with HTH and peptisase S24 domain
LYDLPENVDRPVGGEDSETSTGEDDALTLRLEAAGAGDPRDDDNGVIVASRRQLRAVLGYAPSPDNAFAIVVEGDSMEPWLREGQVAICLRTTEVTVSGRYVYWTGQGGRQVKHIEIAGDEALRITQHGPNPRSELYQHIEGKEYRDESGQTHTIKVIGRIVYPEDTARAVLEEVASKLRSIVGA